MNMLFKGKRGNRSRGPTSADCFRTLALPDLQPYALILMLATLGIPLLRHGCFPACRA